MKCSFLFSFIILYPVKFLIGLMTELIRNEIILQTNFLGPKHLRSVVQTFFSHHVVLSRFYAKKYHFPSDDM